MRNSCIKGEPELVTVGDLAALSSPEHFKDVQKLTEVVSKEFEKLKLLGKGEWISPQGLIYGQGSKDGNRIKHILKHAIPNPNKPKHTVFNVPEKDILSLIDEAWSKRLNVNPIAQANGNSIYNIPMKKVVGTDGENVIRIVVQSETTKIITAFPIKII